ncbi:MAG: hypothetical protein E7018_05200 [Alphaproteobacteria bacterium]|nr:hypothetical protein [Alphaproteobacteria bacterium]
MKKSIILSLSVVILTIAVLVVVYNPYALFQTVAIVALIATIAMGIDYFNSVPKDEQKGLKLYNLSYILMAVLAAIFMFIQFSINYAALAIIAECVVYIFMVPLFYSVRDKE